MTAARRRRPLGHGGRLLALASVIVALIAGIAIAQSVDHYDDARRAALDDARARAVATANGVDAFLESRLQTLVALARGAASSPTPGRWLDDADPAALGFERGVLLLARDGHARAAALPGPSTARPPLRSVDVAAEGWFRAVLSGEPTHVAAGRLAVAGTAPALVLATAVRDGRGRTTGVVAGLAGLDAIEPARLADGRLLVVDATGSLLYDDGPVASLRRVSDTVALAGLRRASGGVEADITGTTGEPDRLVAYESVPRAGWLVIFERPMGDITAAATRTLVSEVAWIVGAGLVSLLALAWASRRVGRSTAEAERARVRAQRMRLVLEAALGRHDVDDLLDGVLRALRRVFAADTATVLLLEPDGSHLRARMAVGVRADVADHLRVPVGEGFAGRILATGEPLVVEDVPASDVVWPALRRHVRTLAGVPLVADGAAFGVLHVGTREQREWAAEEVALLEAAASRIAVAIAFARLREEEQEARLRAETLARTADALARARTADDVARIVHDVVSPVVGASVGTVSLLEGLGESDLVTLRPPAVDDVDLTRLLPAAPGLHTPAVDALRRRWPVCVSSRADLLGQYPGLADEALASGVEAVAALPLLVDGRTMGVLALGFPSVRPFPGDERAFLQSVANQCAQALDLARLVEREHDVAVELQQSLLVRRTGQLEGLRIAVRYLAGTEGLRVGGDWHDVIELGDGRVGLCVGDVVGRGVRAAAAMGQLRSGLAALAPTSSGPAELLVKLDAFAETVPDAAFATVSYAEVDLASGRVRYASAGHPPAVLMLPDGTVTLLADGRSQPLCAAFGELRGEGVCALEEGTKLLLYSDGLVERRGQSLDTRFELLGSLASTFRSLDPEALCDAILDAMGAGARGDDVAMLCVELLPRGVERFASTIPASPTALAPLRRAAREWLAGNGVPAETQDDVVLALGEAVSNAVEHAYLRGRHGEVAVEIELEDGRLVVAVRDTGHWRPPEPSSDRGHGLAIIEALVDDLHLDRSDGGSTVRMLKSVPVASVAGDRG